MPPTDHEAILLEVQRFQQQFVQCHQFLAENTHRLAELLREAESRGILLQDAFTLADVGYWLQNSDWIPPRSGGIGSHFHHGMINQSQSGCSGAWSLTVSPGNGFMDRRVSIERINRLPEKSFVLLGPRGSGWGELA